MRAEVRMLRRLRHETKDWCRSVRGEHSLRTHADGITAQHNPEVWD